MSKVAKYLETAFQWPIVKRAMVLAFIVGPILIAINHGKCLMHGKFDTMCGISSLLTMLVPYCVSTVSSVMAVESDS